MTWIQEVTDQHPGVPGSKRSRLKSAAPSCVPSTSFVRRMQTFAISKLTVLLHSQWDNSLVIEEELNLDTTHRRENYRAGPGFASAVRHYLRTTPWLSTSPCQRHHADGKVYAVGGRSDPHHGFSPSSGSYYINR